MIAMFSTLKAIPLRKAGAVAPGHVEDPAGQPAASGHPEDRCHHHEADPVRRRARACIRGR